VRTCNDQLREAIAAKKRRYLLLRRRGRRGQEKKAGKGVRRTSSRDRWDAERKIEERGRKRSRVTPHSGLTSKWRKSRD